LIEEQRPEVCAVEQLYAHYAHPRTAILMGHARGVILLVAQRMGVQLEQYSANRVKQSLTGHGHASKHQMQRAVQNLWNLKDLPDPPDVADALAVALCCGRALDGARALRPRASKR
jgi:crossover junction endodeoxyribonuclease RuvC